MQLALVGLPAAGVKTLFSAITESVDTAGGGAATTRGVRLAVIQVPDPRLELISRVHQSRKTTPATVEMVELPGLFGQSVDSALLARTREADAVGIVLRAFPSMTVPHLKGTVDPERDLRDILAEMLLSDLAIAESRVARLEAGLSKRKDEEEEQELAVLRLCLQALADGEKLDELDLAPEQERRIRGFGFLTRKPRIVFLNIGDNQLGQEAELSRPFQEAGHQVQALSAGIEAELASLDPADRQVFMEEFGIDQLAAPIVVTAAYRILDVVTFFTYSEQESRAWRVRRGQTAVDAAAKIHTDLARGFIRAEVVGFADFEEFQDLKEIKARGKLRLEGKDYVVQEGDLILIRHSG